MNSIKRLVETILGYIDNGKFFREPMKWLYMTFACLPFLCPLCFAIFCLIEDYDDFLPHFHNGTWFSFTCILTVILIFLWLLITAYINYVFWTNRKDQLNNTVRTNHDIVAIPVCAHYIKSCGESFAQYLFLSIMGIGIIVYVFSLLNGFGAFTGYGHPRVFFIGLFGGLLALIGAAVFYGIICYIIVLTSHVISEKLRIKAQIANDLRDMHDGGYTTSGQAPSPSPEPIQPAPSPVTPEPVYYQPQPTICSNCGRPQEPGERFCVNCGTPYQ